MATFRELAEKVIRLHAKSWKAGSKSPGQWRQTFRDYADPVIGDKPVSEITRSDVLAIVGPIWHDKPSVAEKVLRRVGVVLRYAVAQGLVEHNVAEASALRAALPKANGGGQRHFKALPHGEVAEALARVRASDSPDAARLALEFLVLTASRPGECREAKWAEIDLETATWTIPAERMKANREHRVPLSGRALEVLDQARELSDGSGLVFPSKRTGRPVSDWAFAALRRRADIERDASRLPVQLPGLDGRERRGPRRGRGSAGARGQQRDRGGLSADGPIRASSSAHGGLGGVCESPCVTYAP